VLVGLGLRLRLWLWLRAHACHRSFELRADSAADAARRGGFWFGCRLGVEQPSERISTSTSTSTRIGTVRRLQPL
jgi:hypothetical protein